MTAPAKPPTTLAQILGPWRGLVAFALLLSAGMWQLAEVGSGGGTPLRLLDVGYPLISCLPLAAVLVGASGSRLPWAWPLICFAAIVEYAFCLVCLVIAAIGTNGVFRAGAPRSFRVGETAHLELLTLTYGLIAVLFAAITATVAAKRRDTREIIRIAEDALV